MLTPHFGGVDSKGPQRCFQGVPSEVYWNRLVENTAVLTFPNGFPMFFQPSGRSVGVALAEGGPRGETLMDAVTHLAPTVGVLAACV